MQDIKLHIMFSSDMLLVMPEREKQRNETSSAVIALRKAMGMTQQRFAVEALNVAIATVARYETSHPPRGEVLLKLAGIAKQNASGNPINIAQPLIDLSDTFLGLYIEEVRSNLGFQLLFSPGRGKEGAYGYILDKLTGRDEIAFAQDFLTVKRCLDSTDPDCKAQVSGARVALSEAARVCGHPIASQLRDAVLGDAKDDTK
jgi:transcriptional regulator with XRE-family HTH domain